MSRHTSCTSLDHIYPIAQSGTPCYCGRRVWGGGPRRKQQRLKVGAVVQVANAANEGTRTIVERVYDDGEYLYRIDGAPVNGRKLFERSELEVSHV